MITKTQEEAIILATRNRTTEWMRTFNIQRDTKEAIKNRALKYLRQETAQRGYSAAGWEISVVLEPNEMIRGFSIEITPPPRKAFPVDATLFEHSVCGKKLPYSPADCDLCDDAESKVSEMLIADAENISVTLLISEDMVIEVFTRVLRERTGREDLYVKSTGQGGRYKAYLKKITLGDICV